MKQRMIVDKSSCIGCAVCTMVCTNNEMFMDFDGKAWSSETADPEESVIDACPVQAISVTTLDKWWEKEKEYRAHRPSAPYQYTEDWDKNKLS